MGLFPFFRQYHIEAGLGLVGLGVSRQYKENFENQPTEGLWNFSQKIL
jgi:hypothetical protein